ncbi:MAG TPA: hypothetical protein VGV62_00920 [Xanthobacteraceae bacterium]|nr:hypothetical protein [Xanthobacteraceae bacterium]
MAAAIPPQRRIRKPLHRILLQCRIPAVVVVRTQAAAVLILLGRSPVVARIQAAVRRILLARGRVAARIPAAALLILLVRIRVAARIQAAVRLILLVHIRVVARIPARHHTLRPAAAQIQILRLQVIGPGMARRMRFRRSARRMRHKVISPANTRALPQPTISTRTPRTAISMPTSGAGMLQIV